MDSHPPHDKTEFAIRFGCAFLFFGAIIALSLIRVIDGMGVIPAIAAWALITLAISFAAGRFGDPVWHALIRWFHHW